MFENCQSLHNSLQSCLQQSIKQKNSLYKKDLHILFSNISHIDFQLSQKVQRIEPNPNFSLSL